MSNTRKKQAVRVTVVGMIINIFLTIFKFTLGILGKSTAMVADSIHSFSDFATDIVALLSFRISHKPEDENHHYGHGKFETLAGLTISIVLLIVGLGIFYFSSLKVYKIWQGELAVKPEVIAVIAALVAFITKEWLYRYTIKAGKKINSQAVIANAWEHRSDAFSSIGAFIGIGGAVLLGGKWVILDPLAGVIVSIFIIKMGFSLTYENVIELSESAMTEDQIKTIEEIAGNVRGVHKPHNIKTRKIGHYYAIDLHIGVASSFNVTRAHNIGSEVKKQLRKKFGRNTFTSIHIDPFLDK